MPRPWFTTTEIEPFGESDLPQAAIVLGAAGTLLSAAVWLYIGYRWVKGSAVDHNVASTVRILGAVGLLGGFPAGLAVLIGGTCLLQRRASRPFRRRSAVAILLGLVGIGGAAAIQLVANHGR